MPGPATLAAVTTCALAQQQKFDDNAGEMCGKSEK
jgi:hypothetical protein